MLSQEDGRTWAFGEKTQAATCVSHSGLVQQEGAEGVQQEPLPAPG